MARNSSGLRTSKHSLVSQNQLKNASNTPMIKENPHLSVAKKNELIEKIKKNILNN